MVRLLCQGTGVMAARGLDRQPLLEGVPRHLTSAFGISPSA